MSGSSLVRCYVSSEVRRIGSLGELGVVKVKPKWEGMAMLVVRKVVEPI